MSDTQFSKTRGAIAAAIAAVALLGGCTHSDNDARTAVEAFGLTDVQLQGYAFFGCPDDDPFRTRFTAANAKGRRVRGVVCGQLLTGDTVRITGSAQ